jgi:hypothetical protein
MTDDLAVVPLSPCALAMETGLYLFPIFYINKLLDLVESENVFETQGTPQVLSPASPLDNASSFSSTSSSPTDNWSSSV